MTEPAYSEFGLFLLFYELDRLGYLLQSRLKNGIIPEVSTKHVQAVLKELNKKRDWAFTQLPQYGVEPFKTTGETITEEFRAWYKWWRDFYLTLPEEKYAEKVIDATLRPSGTWKDLIGKC
jgi:hypothetical protein